MKIIVKGLMIVLFLGFYVAGCGRKGSLEAPPLTSVEKSMQGTSAAKNENDKPFILDRLIK
ncbi:lipoprotein [Bartonella massiliensis]|uniref:lipoprotein n=1 Tax=Bartonella massiliensis TaxID=929795 RepID=UPI0011589B5A|nr:lipoprotein [Bartonella massiliensis]